MTEEELQKYCMALAKIEKHSHEGMLTEQAWHRARKLC